MDGGVNIRGTPGREPGGPNPGGEAFFPVSTIAPARIDGPVAGARTGVRDPATLAVFGALTAGFLAVFFRFLVKQHQFSRKFPADWGHSYFIPLISGYLIWQRRAELARLRPRAFWPGLAPLLLGIMAYFFFLATPAANHMLQGASIIVALLGLLLLLLGPAYMPYLFLPVCYLAFGIRISQQIMEQFTFRLKLWASQGSYVMLKVIGAFMNFGVELNGNTLIMIKGNTTPMPPLDVADACSGMRMVIAFFALAAAVALLSCRHWWQRTALLIMATPVALFLNIIRVSVLAIASLWFQNAAAGQAHMLIGTILLIPGLGLFMLLVWILNKAVQDAPPEGSPA
jgi:exosortase